jgi:ankyrin repeat protein
LFFAAKCNRTQLASALLKNGANVNAEAEFKNDNSDVQIYTPLMFASMNGNLAAAEILVQSGAEIDKSELGKENALSLAIKNKHLDVAEFLLKHKANVNVRIGCTEYNPNGGILFSIGRVATTIWMPQGS